MNFERFTDRRLFTTPVTVKLCESPSKAGGLPFQLPRWAYYGYLGLYNLAYMLDDSVMLAVAVATLGRHKLQEREGRWLKLLSGLVMLGLGVVLLVKPEWLAG